MISDNNMENFELEGLNDLNRQEDIKLENEVLVFLIQNYLSIKFTEVSIKYQTEFFSYNNKFPDEMIGKLHFELNQKGYIDCTLTVFKSIFFNKNNHEKVNWLKIQTSFKYFIQSLILKNNVNCSKQWVVSSGCFLINGKEKTPIQLAKIGKTTHEIKQEIDNILKVFS